MNTRDRAKLEKKLAASHKKLDNNDVLKLREQIMAEIGHLWENMDLLINTMPAGLRLLWLNLNMRGLSLMRAAERPSMMKRSGGAFSGAAENYLRSSSAAVLPGWKRVR